MKQHVVSNFHHPLLPGATVADKLRYQPTSLADLSTIKYHTNRLASPFEKNIMQLLCGKTTDEPHITIDEQLVMW
jgi:hypothetical protein